MKRLFAVLLLLLLTSSPVFAKGGSGGQLPDAPASSLDQPALTPSGTSAPPESVPAEAPKGEVKKAEPKAPAAPAALKGKKNCGELPTIAERVTCRLNVSTEILKDELKNAYFPEGCRRGKAEWQDACKKRYKAIGPCWYQEKVKGDSYPTEKIYSCLKQQLKLADGLKPTADYCKGKDATCAEDYKKSVYNLIIARFYDAEQRAESLMQQGRLTKEDTGAFVTFISLQKLAFYDAKTKAERTKIIQDVNAEWQNLLKKVK